MRLARGIVGALFAALLSTTTTGCLKKVLIDGQIGGTRDGADAVNTLQDFEVARSVARAGLGQLEGLYKLAPYNEDALFLLTKGWAGASFAFTEDDYEESMEKKDDQLTEYNRQRSIAGFQRAKFFAIQLLKMKANGFDEATRNADTIKAWLDENFRDPKEALDLTWIATAWLGHVDIAKDVPSIVANLYVGVAIAERAAELDDTVEYGTIHVLLGAYHARTAMSELDESKKEFEKALAINHGKYLLTQLNYASRYYCAKSDRASYEKELNAVLAAGDPLPDERLSNLLAKRRARRYLDNKVFQEDCGFTS